MTVACDVSRHSDRQLTAEVPAFTSLGAFFSPHQLLAETQAGALSYNVSLRVSPGAICVSRGLTDIR